MGLQKLAPNSSATLQLTVLTGSTPVTTATVTATLIAPDGTRSMVNTPMTHQAAGLYTTPLSAALTTQHGIYTVEYSVVNAGLAATELLEFVIGY